MFKEVKKIVSKSTLAAVAIMAVSQGQAMENYRPAGIEKHPDLLAQYNANQAQYQAVVAQCAQDVQDALDDCRANRAAITANYDTRLNNLATVRNFAAPLMRSDRNMALRIMLVVGDNHCAAIANIITQSANDPILGNRANLVANYLNQHGL